jgi:pimeloyl-ACP methyl ester carboxylesterase
VQLEPWLAALAELLEARRYNREMPKPILQFSHANGFPAGTYRQFLAPLGEHFDVRAIDMLGHDPRHPVRDGWDTLADQLIETLEHNGAPALLVGHSLGGMVSLLAALRRPELARAVIMLDSPVVAGWRALLWRLAKHFGRADQLSPARLSRRRRQHWPNRDAVRSHLGSKALFAGWFPGVFDDYLDSALMPGAEGGLVLRFSREVETEIFRTLPHDLGRRLGRPFPVPVGFIGGTDSNELRQAGRGATRRLVGPHYRELPGSHLFPMELPRLAAETVLELAERLDPALSRPGAAEMA